MSADEMREAARALVADMPPLTTEQIGRIARLVRGEQR